MKKFILSLGLIAMAFGLTNCTQNDDFDTPAQPAQEFDLYVASPRTTNSGMNTLWANGDALNVFHTEADTDDFVKDEQFTLVDAATGHFKGNLKEGATLTAEAYDWYACYPSSTAASFTKPGSKGRSFIIGNSNAVGQQTQVGNNSTSHMAGNNLPLVGVAKGVAANESPALTMQHTASMVKFLVKNLLNEPITVNSIEVSVPNYNIAGYFYIDFTDMENIVYSAESGKTSSTTKLVVSGGAPIEANGEAAFYLAVAPFTKEAGEEATITITATNGEGVVGECIKDATAAAMTFTAGKFKDITLRYNTPFESLPSVSTESEPYIVGFEASEGFVATTSYKVAEARYTGAEEQQWGTVYGTPSTTGKISGEQCMHIKTYPIDGVWSESYTFTNFTLSTVKQLQFAAASENYNNLKVSYRVLGGAWTDLPTFELSSTGNTYNYVFDTAVKNAQFKFTIVPTRATSGTGGKYVVIDNVVFAGEELAEDFRPIAATVKATTGSASDVDTAAGTTATLNGSYELYDAVGDESVVCGFDWKASTGNYTTVTATANGKTFSYALTGLTAGTEYTFRAWASLDGGSTKSYGEEATFTPSKTSADVKSITLTSSNIKNFGATAYADTDIKSTTSDDGSTWYAYKARKTVNVAYIAISKDYPDGYLATPIVNGNITKIVMNLKSTGASTKFTLSNGTSGSVFYTSGAMGKTEQDWTVEGDAIAANCNQIAIRSASGVVTINSVTIYYTE